MEQFRDYYNNKFDTILGGVPTQEQGIPRIQLQKALDKRHVQIPAALFEYYVLAGRHPINTEHNCLRTVDELDWMDDKLVFMDENQNVVFWGIDRNDLSKDDPIVWQGVNSEPMEWYEEDFSVSRFMMAMWEWITTGEMPANDETYRPS